MSKETFFFFKKLVCINEKVTDPLFPVCDAQKENHQDDISNFPVLVLCQTTAADRAFELMHQESFRAHG